MSDKERSQLYSLVALSWARVPAFREYLGKMYSHGAKAWTQKLAKDADKFYASVKSYEADTGKFLGDHEKLRQSVLDGYYEITQSKSHNIGRALDMSPKIEAILESEYRHDLLYAPKWKYYMAADNPVITFEPDGDGMASVGCGFGHPRTQVLMPLNKRVCLLLRRGAASEKVEASELRVQKINDLTMAVAQRTIYGPEGTRRMARIFNERGCKVKYGQNAFMASPPVNR
jgi:hypothetical protein